MDQETRGFSPEVKNPTRVQTRLGDVDRLLDRADKEMTEVIEDLVPGTLTQTATRIQSRIERARSLRRILAVEAGLEREEATA